MKTPHAITSYNTQIKVSRLEDNEHRAEIKLLAHGPLRSQMQPLPYPLFHSQAWGQEVADAGHSILRSLLKVVRGYIKDHGRDALLELLNIEQKFHEFISWESIEANDLYMARFDFVPDASGSGKFCEFNIDSAIGGYEAHEYYKNLGGLEKSANSWKVVGDHFAKVCELFALKRIIILDWQMVVASGVNYPLEFTRNIIAQSVQHLEVEILVCDEKNILQHLTADTLVYRIHTFEDVDDEFHTYREIKRTTKHFYFDFESRILSSKKWLVLLLCPSFRTYLDEEDVVILTDYLPAAEILTAENEARLIKEKDHYFFKSFDGNSGQGVYYGKDVSGEVIAALAKDHPGEYIAQEAIDTLTILVQLEEGEDPVDVSVVLGPYLLFGTFAGMLARASRSTKIINASKGKGKISWSFPRP